MEATLKFDLPKENNEFYLSTNGSKYRSVVWDIDNWLREQMDYNEDLMPNQYEAHDATRKKLREYMYEIGLNIDDIQ